MSRKSLLLAILLSACSGGPLPFMAGGKLDGDVKPTPASFAFAKDAGTIQLETRPEDPYSVNVAGAIVGDGLYVSAGDNRANWVENMETNPLVRARIEGDVYELKARRVTDSKEMDAFAESWLALGAWARDPRKLDGEPYVYRLEPR